MILCKDCKYCKTKKVGYVSFRSFCEISAGSKTKGTKLGVQLWSKKPHPKCPLSSKQKNLEFVTVPQDNGNYKELY